MNLKQAEAKDRGRVQAALSGLFVVDILARLIDRRSVYERSADDGKDHSAELVKKLQSRRLLRSKR